MGKAMHLESVHRAEEVKLFRDMVIEVKLTSKKKKKHEAVFQRKIRR